MKNILSYLLILSVGCTCLVSTTLASALGTPAPCHQMQDKGQNDDQKKSCCSEKAEAWKETTEIDEEMVFVFPPVVFSGFVLLQKPDAKAKESPRFTTKKAPPDNTLGWENIRIII